MSFYQLKYLLFLILLCRVGMVDAALQDIFNSTNSSIKNTLEEAIMDYFQNSDATDTLHIRIQFEYLNFYQRDRFANFQHILANSSKFSYKINIQNADGKNHFNIEQFDNAHHLWYVDSYTAFVIAIKQLRHRIKDSTGMFILIHKNVTKLDNEMEVKKILMHAYDIGILNFVATYAESVNRTLTYSFKRFSPNKCRQFQPVITNIFENGRFKNKELFVKRYSNFHNCEIRVYVRNAPPFIVYEPRTPNSSEYVLKGIEGELIKTIAKALNFRISVRNESELSWGTVFLNGTMTFPYDMLRDGKVDILLGIFFSSAEVLHYFSGSLSYLRAPYVFVAKRSTKQKNFEVTWILDPYKWSTWICLAAYLVIVKLLMKITFTGKFRNSAFSVHKAKHSNWLRLFGIALNVPQNVVNSRNPFCFSIIIWCFGFIVFNSAYQGKLYSSYTNLNPEKELFLKDVLKHNYLILTRGPSEVAKILTFVKLLPNRFVNYNLTDPNAIFDVLLNRTEKFVGTLTTLHRFLYHMQTKRLFDNFRLVQEPLSVQQICAYFHNNSFLVEPFNNVIRMLNDAGLISKWMNDAFYMLKYKNIDILKGRLIRSTTPDPLKLEPLKPLFIAFILLELITVLVFIGEVTIHRWKMQHKKFISVNSRRRAQY